MAVASVVRVVSVLSGVIGATVAVAVIGVIVVRFEAVFDCFKRYYVEHCMVKTDLYPGVADLLHELKTAGYKIAIVSNKLKGGVDELYRHYFQDTVQVAVGERAGVRRKPAPDMV